jgi:ATP-binding cassette subfamily F protein 3
MLQIKGLAKAFRGEWLFRSLDLQINERDRIGLVGDNGTGKSSLMKMIAGHLPPDDGEIIGARDLTFGYLPQDGLFVRGRTLMEETLSVFGFLKVLEKEMQQLEHELAEMDHLGLEYEKKLERYSLISQEYRMKEGYSIEAKAGSVLLGLGFTQKDLQRPCEDFSGGWQMRIALAKLLLQRPGLLLLDEPTNHLDLEARNWLEDYLKTYPKSLLLVSHDRFFLDATISRVLEIRNRTIHFYRGNYTDFLRQREERMTRLLAAYEAQQKEIARIKAFAARFRYKATKAAQVQSRLKELERMERIEVPPETKPIHFRFPQGPRTGRIVLELSDVDAGYEGKTVFRNLNLILERGERVALVGSNGAGKSTLMKVLAGLLLPFKGRRREGHNVVVSYFSQDQDDLLTSQKTVWDEVYAVAPNRVVPQLRTLLGCFLFSGDDIDKPTSVLSGGERSRLLLCKLLLSPANCLLMDEPTNHLDLRSKDILMESMMHYEGTLVFVSHDRYFLNGVATKILEIGNQTAIPYLGNYEDYVHRKEFNNTPKESPPEDESGQTASPSGKDSPKNRSDFGRKKVNPYKIRHTKEKIEQLEAKIQLNETRISVLTQMLASEELYRDHQLFRSTMEEHDQLQKELTRFMDQWEKLNSELELLKGKQ